MKKKGFTLVELLVVIAIIALLMSILMPALARVRAIAFRMVCGSNLSGIGKAMLIYANDYEDELPRAGFKDSVLGVPIWNAANPAAAFATGASVTSCFYNLVKFAEVTPKSFVCKSDSGCSEFKLADHTGAPPELIQAYDFGGATSPDHPRKHCSYSYHQPLPSSGTGYAYALTTSSEPGMAIAADWNPWTPLPPGPPTNPEGGIWSEFIKIGEQPAAPAGTSDQQKEGNAVPHQKEGQNALFLDGHVYFEKRAYCGMEDDNIYTLWSGTPPWSATNRPGKRLGIRPNAAGFAPKDRTDSLLINDAKKAIFCFPADMLVWVDGALVQISKAATGQAVGKFNCAAVTARLEQIEGVHEHEGVFECRDIVLENGNCISVVDSHCFLLDDGQWEMATKLRSGLKLKSLNGPIGIKYVAKRTMPFVGKVYNLKVKDSHRYLVGQDAVVVRDY